MATTRRTHRKQHIPSLRHRLCCPQIGCLPRSLKQKQLLCVYVTLFWFFANKRMPCKSLEECITEWRINTEHDPLTLSVFQPSRLHQPEKKQKKSLGLVVVSGISVVRFCRLLRQQSGLGKLQTNKMFLSSS